MNQSQVLNLKMLFKNFQKIKVQDLTSQVNSFLDGQQAHEKMLNITNY